MSHKAHFRAIAEELSKDGQQFYAYFNYFRKCVEIGTESGEAIASVEIHGSEGVAYEAIVETELVGKAKDVFAYYLPISVYYSPLSADKRLQPSSS